MNGFNFILEKSVERNTTSDRSITSFPSTQPREAHRHIWLVPSHVQAAELEHRLDAVPPSIVKHDLLAIEELAVLATPQRSLGQAEGHLVESEQQALVGHGWISSRATSSRSRPRIAVFAANQGFPFSRR